MHSEKRAECTLSVNVASSFFTAVQDLYHPTRLGLVEPPAKVAGEDWILVYGGSCAYLIFVSAPQCRVLMPVQPGYSRGRPVHHPARTRFGL